MTRPEAATEYRRLRNIFISRQRSLGVRFGPLPAAEQFDDDAGRYLSHVCGLPHTPDNFVYAARAMLGRVMSDHEAHAA